jgi:hypothetical protein
MRGFSFVGRTCDSLATVFDVPLGMLLSDELANTFSPLTEKSPVIQRQTNITLRNLLLLIPFLFMFPP